MNVIETAGVHKWCGAQHVLNQIDLTLGQGERLVICGPSGAGKTLLLHCLAGLEVFDRGRITVMGKDHAAGRRAPAERHAAIGMVFAQNHLFEHLTLAENCMLAPMRVQRKTRAEAEALAAEFLERAQLSAHAYEYPQQLTPAQRRCAAIARALCLRPPILLIDELADEKLETLRPAQDVLAALAKEGASMVCVTRDMAFARAIAERILFMDVGQIIEENPPEAFFRHPRHGRTRLFLGQMLGKAQGRAATTAAGQTIAARGI